MTALDLAALGPGIVAISGPNGSGKTSLLECVPGALFRTTPSRGSIANLATSRDTLIELEGENGDPFRIILNVDNVSGRQEALLFDGAGEPLAGPKVRDFDIAAAKKFGTIDIYLAALFASQTGAGSVLKMSRSDRRALFGRLLGTERLELMAGLARERARAAETEMAGARAALEAIRSGAGDILALEAGLAMAKEAEAVAAAAARDSEVQVRTARIGYEAAVAAVTDAEKSQQAVAEARRRVDELHHKFDRAMEQEEGLRHKVDQLASILEQAPGIRAAAERWKALAEQADQVRVAGETLAAEHSGLQAEAQKRSSALYLAENSLKDAVRVHDEGLSQAEDARRRLAASEKATKGVPCAGLLEDEKRAGCPALVGHFRTRSESQKVLDDFGRKEESLEKGVASAQERQVTAIESVRAINEQASRVGKDLSARRAEYQPLRRQADELKRQDRTSELDKAEAEMGILRQSIASAEQVRLAAEADYKAAEIEATKLAAAAAAANYDELAAADEALGAANAAMENALLDVKGAGAAVVRFEVQLTAAREAHAKAQAIQERLAPMERDLSDWRWLGRGLGREGVQALELDAAGPRVSGLANELLADAYGPRFQIRFETQAAKADGKGVKETFDVVVVDTERGREGNGEDLSGGEKVIVGEALGLAVGLFHAQAAGVSLGTVIRDETVGALDPENGERYLAMLRGFLRVGHVHQLLYVAHNPALVEMADAVVHVEDGRIEVR